MPHDVVFKALGFGLIWLLFLLVLVVLLLSLAKKFVNHFNDRGAYLVTFLLCLVTLFVAFYSATILPAVFSSLESGLLPF
jgi:hypothetical protein